MNYSSKQSAHNWELSEYEKNAFKFEHVDESGGFSQWYHIVHRKTDLWPTKYTQLDGIKIFNSWSPLFKSRRNRAEWIDRKDATLKLVLWGFHIKFDVSYRFINCIHSTIRRLRIQKNLMWKLDSPQFPWKDPTKLCSAYTYFSSIFMNKRVTFILCYILIDIRTRRSYTMTVQFYKYVFALIHKQAHSDWQSECQTNERQIECSRE